MRLQLQKLSTFVDEQKMDINYKDDLERMVALWGYTFIIRSKPQRWMFEACDDKGNVIEEPCRDELSSFSEERYAKFSEAKDNTWFTGFDKDMIDFYLNHTSVEALIDLDTFYLTQTACRKIWTK